MRYFIRSEAGVEQGPYAWHELQQGLRANEISREAWVRAEGSTSWMELRALEEEKASRRAGRDRHEIEHASRAPRSPANSMIAGGAAMIVLGLGASVVSLAAGPVALVFVGVVVSGVVMLVRGLAARP